MNYGSALTSLMANGAMHVGVCGFYKYLLNVNIG